MSRRLLFWIFAGAFAAASSNACAQKDPGKNDQRVLSNLARAHSCRALRFSITSGAHLSLSDHERCTLVVTALDYVAHGGAVRAGMSPHDRSTIARAGVFAFEFTTMGGGPADRFWTVEFEFADRSYAIIVRIDRKSGAVTAGRGEKSPS
jgi:hypothetical protein